jgi:RNA polymerase sigma-70 factor, ECF subfamily
MKAVAAMQAAPMTSDNLGAAFIGLRASLRRYLRRRVRDPAVVEDLIQDIFVKAVAAIAARRAPSNLAGWLYAAARNAVVDFYRSARPGIVPLEEDLPDMKHADDQQLHQQLATCLRPLALQLPPIYRDTLIATDFEGKTMQSLADEQDVSLSAIKSRASRARSMLKDKLLDCCHVETSAGLVVDYHRRTRSRCADAC